MKLLHLPAKLKLFLFVFQNIDSVLSDTTMTLTTPHQGKIFQKWSNNWTYKKSLLSYQSFSVVHYDKTVDLSHDCRASDVSILCASDQPKELYRMIIYITLAQLSTQLLVESLAEVPYGKWSKIVFTDLIWLNTDHVRLCHQPILSITSCIATKSNVYKQRMKKSIVLNHSLNLVFVLNL